MIINLSDYFEKYIGDISWYGETNHDYKSRENMDKADKVLYFLECAREDILGNLREHKIYRKGNATAEMLHKKARKLCERYDNEYKEEDWNIKDED